MNYIYKKVRLPFIRSTNTIKIKINPQQKINDIKKYESQYNIIFKDYDIDNDLSNFYEIYYKLN